MSNDDISPPRSFVPEEEIHEERKEFPRRTYILLSTIVDISSPRKPITNSDFHVIERIGFTKFFEHVNILSIFQPIFPYSVVDTFELKMNRMNGINENVRSYRSSSMLNCCPIQSLFHSTFHRIFTKNNECRTLKSMKTISFAFELFHSYHDSSIAVLFCQMHSPLFIHQIIHI